MNRRQIGGMSIMLGNGALFANGLIAYKHGQNPEARGAGVSRMVSGALYTGVGALLARYGNLPVEKQLEKLQGKFAAYLKREGVPLDAEQLQKADKETQKGWFAKMEDFAYDHPMECANIYNLISATGMLGSGLLRRKQGEYTAGNANIASYLMILAGTLTSVLVTERTPEQIAAKGQDGTLWGSVQKQPLNYAVWPYLAGDLSFGFQAHGEYQQAKNLPKSDASRNWGFGMAGISAFVMVASAMGDMLTGFSSKKTGGKPEERDKAREELIESAASILALQPPETQKMLTHKAAEYLAKQQGLRMVDLDVEKLTHSIAAAIMKHQAALLAQSAPRGQIK